MAINEKEFVLTGQARWNRLRELVGIAENSPKAIKKSEIAEMMVLYKKTCGDLALVQTDQANPGLRYELNTLVGKAHSTIYRERPKKFLPAVQGALALAAGAMRRKFLFVLISVVFFLSGASLSYFTLATRPDLRELVITPDAEPNFEAWKKGLPGRGVSEGTMATAFYSSNNPRVAMMIGGVSVSTFGIGSGYLMYANGLGIGALYYEMSRIGKGGMLLTWLFPHGASELTGMFISGAAGLIMGWALINPGKRTRGQALLEESKDAMALLTMSVIMMFIAAPFEGFISFQPFVPNSVKLLIGTVVLTAWVCFWVFYGRDSDQKPVLAV